MRPISRAQNLFAASMLVSALSFMVMAPACRRADNPGAKHGDPWASAEAALAEHIAPLVKRLRAQYDDPRAQYAEIRSALLRKYLPDHRIREQSDR
jgi:hypothetical protein